MQQAVEKLAGKKCLVTGGAGFIGSHLVDLLIEEGAQVRVLDNLATGKKENLAQHFGKAEFEFLEGSILEPRDIQRALQGIELIFHLVCRGVRHSIKYPEKNHLVNAHGTLKLLQAVRATESVRYFTHVSSSEVYGTSRQAAMDEEHPTFPHTVYGAGKLAGEAYARAFYLTYRMPVAVIRPFNVFGPRSHFEGDAGEMIPKSLLRALTGHPVLVFGEGSQERDFTYVTDTARAIVEITASRLFTGETVNIGSGRAVTIREIAEKIISLTPGTNAGIEYTEARPGDVQRLLCDTGLLKKKLGFTPQVSFEQGLARVIGWFRENENKLGEWYAADTGKNWQ